MCARYLAYKLGDQRLVGWHQRYVSAVDEYYAMYCECAIAEARGSQCVIEPLLREKKAEMVLLRQRILNRTAVAADRRTGSDHGLTSSGFFRKMARPNGDEKTTSRTPAATTIPVPPEY